MSGWRAWSRTFEFAVFAIDAGQVADDFGDAHDGHIFRADDALQAAPRPCAVRPFRRRWLARPCSESWLRSSSISMAP